MFFTISQKLQLLFEIDQKFKNGVIVFDPSQLHFGFKRMQQLYPVVDDEIKGYPCIAYNKLTDSIKYGVKIIPLELKFDLDNHPANIEIILLELFKQLVIDSVTPHITFYFKALNIPNTKKSVTMFPLKGQKKYIYKHCNILIAEYVPGGSIQEFVQEQPNLSDRQWKYIIFSMAWTLFILQSKYEFMHNDFHYGNILIDTTIDPLNKSYLQYQLILPDDTQITYSIQNAGILAKLWDLEFAATKNYVN